MKRRELLGAGSLTLLGGGIIGTALGYGPLAAENTSRPAYLGQAAIVYERDRLRLRARPGVVRHGETITFEITHTGESESIILGCENPWAIQTYEDGEWKHAVWTAGRHYNACATLIGPGDTKTETVPLSGDALAEQRYIGEVDFEFTPGTYRFVLIGSHPYLAVNFSIHPSA